MDLVEYQEQLGIQFRDEGLLQMALTHRSYVNEHVDEDIEDNERLEYLGDAILDFITADMLYRRFPNMTEGEMTRLRAALVRTEALAQFALDVKLGEALRMGKGESNTGGRLRDNNLASGFEAVVGALYIDQGLDAVGAFVIPHLTELQKDVMEEAINKDPRSQFQEWAQARYSITPRYRMTDSDGPDHEKRFTVGVFVGRFAVTDGQGRSKRAAAQDAASNALMLRDQDLYDALPDPKTVSAMEAEYRLQLDGDQTGSR